MNVSFSPPELLAPAGGMAQLKAALTAGADAVYVGVDRFNMRTRAENFTPDALRDITRQAHEAGAKAYLALNTLIFETELPEMDRILTEAKDAGMDAVIAADWSVVHTARALSLPVHISTQLSVSNSRTLAFLFERGIRRVVLARECSLQDLRAMREALEQTLGPTAAELEFEVFAHGAMCIAESGRCFMSGYETGRSASRGDCAQPCRRAYHITSARGASEFELEGEYVMSPKDLCTLPFLDQLLDAGVASLKIEGRNRSPDYVFTVVNAYREAVDALTEARNHPDKTVETDAVLARSMDAVEQVYNRGFSSGYYMGRPVKAWTTSPGNRSSVTRAYIGQVLKTNPRERRTRLRLESGPLSCGDDVFFEGPETGFLSLTVSSLRRNGKDISTAEKGTEVDLIADVPVRPADKLYRYVPR